MIPEIPIAQLWESADASQWNDRLDRYWALVQPRNMALEREMERLDLQQLAELDAVGWFNWLHDRYFRWKYTAPNRYATTTICLRKWRDTGRLPDLLRIRNRLLGLAGADIAAAIAVAVAIPGLGTAGASGLLALLYPTQFATVDQFVVKALCDVPSLPERGVVARMKPEGLTTPDAVTLIRIMRRKAGTLSQSLASPWTPRLVDKVLWTYGRA